MPHLFDRRDWFGNSPAVWILAAMLFVTPVACWSLKQIRVENDLNHWLPANDPVVSITDEVERQFPVDEHIVLSWDGSSLSDPRIDALKNELEPVRDKDGVPRGGIPQIAGIVDPRDLLTVMQRQSVPPHEAARRLQGALIGAGPLRVRLTEAGRARLRRMQLELPEAAEHDLGIRLRILDPTVDLSTLALIPGFTNDSGDVSDPSAPAVLSPSGDLQEDGAVDHDLSITWRGIGVGAPQTLQMVEWLTKYRGAKDAADTPLVERCFFVPGAPVAMSVTLSEAGLADKSETLQLIRQAAQKIGIADSELRLSGSAVVGTQLDRTVAMALWNPDFPLSSLHRRSVLLTSLLVCAGMAFVLLRDFRLATIALFASGFTTFVTMSVAPVLGGTLDLVLVLLPPLTMMFALLGSVHVVQQCQRAATANPRTAVVDACRKVVRPCLLAAVTAAIGAASLCLSPIGPIRSFGLCAAIGALLSGVMAAYGVPALLLFWRGKLAAADEIDRPGWRWWGGVLVVRPGWQSLAMIAACFACSVGLVSGNAKMTLLGEFPDSSRIVHDQWALENHLAGMTSLELLVRFDAAAQDEANFFDRLELVRALEERLRQHPEITGCVALTDFHPVSETPEDGASMLALNRYHKRAGSLQEQIREGAAAGGLNFYKVLQMDRDKPADPLLAQPADELWRIATNVNGSSAADRAAILHDVNEIARDILRFQSGAQHTIAGALPRDARIETALMDGFLRAALVTGSAILLLVMIELRSVGAGLVAMLTNLASIGAVFGVSRLLGMTIELGVLTAAPIAVGIAAGGSLVYLLRFRACYAEGQSRKEAVVNSLAECGPPMLQASLSLIAGLLVLTTAELLPISRLGAVMSGAVGATALVQAVLLPQLLSTLLGRWFTTSIEPVKSSTASAPNDTRQRPPLENAA